MSGSAHSEYLGDVSDVEFLGPDGNVIDYHPPDNPARTALNTLVEKGSRALRVFSTAAVAVTLAAAAASAAKGPDRQTEPTNLVSGNSSQEGE